jgi:hypothetical protein
MTLRIQRSAFRVLRFGFEKFVGFVGFEELGRWKFN